MGAGKGVGPSARRPENREPVQPEHVGDFFDVAWPIEDGPIALEVRQSVAWPVERDEANACRCRRLVGELGLKPRAGMSVKVEPGRAIGPSILGVSETSSVAER